MVGNSLFFVMLMIIFIIFYVAHPFFGTKTQVSDFSASDIAYLSKRIIPLFILFIFVALIWAAGQEYHLF